MHASPMHARSPPSNLPGHDDLRAVDRHRSETAPGTAACKEEDGAPPPPPLRGIPPRKWGPSAWVFIHYLCLGYPERPTPADADDYRSFFATLPFVLPCQACRSHLADNLQETPPDEALSRGRDALFAWSVELHNMVNKALGKPEMDLDRARRVYIHTTMRPTSFSARCAECLVAACVGAAAVLALILLMSRVSGRSRRR